MTFLRTTAVAAALVALLSACTPGRALGPQEAVLVACSGYDATLRSLAGYRAVGRLSDRQVATVDQWRPVLNDTCLAEEPPDSATAADLLDTIERAMFDLIMIQRSPEG